MDWIRRNWPDLLIGFALLAVISGIVATLLTGGSFFPGQGNQTARQPAAQTEPVQPPAQTQPQTAQQDDGAIPGQQSDVTGLPLIDTDPLADGPVDPFAVTEEPSAAEQQEAAEADAADPLDLPSVVALRPGTDPESVPAPAQQPAAQPQQPAQQQSAAAPAEAPVQSTTSTSSGDLPSSTVPYTVGVGAFRNQENAERQANVFRQAGYPVVVASQDDFTVVLLGPYANRSEADRVLDTVTSGGFGVAPIVYTYQDDEGDAQTSTSTAPAATEPAQQTPAATAAPAAQESAPAPAATATGAGRFLQVGAYSSTDNASAQTDQLESLGYTVTQEQDGALIRVLVGPFEDNQITGARNRLAAQGIDSVPR